MIRDEKTFEFNTHVVVVKNIQDGVVRKYYTDDPGIYISNLSGNPRFEVTSSVFTPTEEEIKRRDKALLLPTEVKSKLLDYIVSFIETGYLSRVDNDALGQYLTEFIESSNKAAINVISPALATYRYNKEVNGFDHKGLVVKTDRESQATLTSIMVRFQSNQSTSVDFKFANGWKRLEADEFMELAKEVGGFVEKCFRVEGIANMWLENATRDEIGAIMEPATMSRQEGIEKFFEDVFENPGNYISQPSVDQEDAPTELPQVGEITDTDSSGE